MPSMTANCLRDGTTLQKTANNFFFLRYPPSLTRRNHQRPFRYSTMYAVWSRRMCGVLWLLIGPTNYSAALTNCICPESFTGAGWCWLADKDKAPRRRRATYDMHARYQDLFMFRSPPPLVGIRAADNRLVTRHPATRTKTRDVSLLPGFGWFPL